VAASAGAACHSDTVEVSHVLKAMDIPIDWAKGTLRLTTGRMTTTAEIDSAVQIICAAVDKLKA
jgi:cysteine desulfurase